MYNPFDNYWLASDGRLYSSKLQTIVPNTNSNYQIWCNGATRWPKDDNGNQTDAELQTVLNPYGLLVSTVPTVATLLEYAGNKQNSVLAQIWTFNIGTQTAPVTVTTKLDTAGQFAMTKLGLWLQLNDKNATISYSNVDYTGFELTQTQVSSLISQVTAIDSQTYTVLNKLSSGISSIPATISTQAQIDNAPWPQP